jgi:RNA polymerase sigma-70 factor, ECF subfamily
MLQQYQQAIVQYRQRVYSFAFYSLRAREDAEDVTQDVFIRLWQHWNRIDHERLGAWLMRVTHNAVVDHIRKSRTKGTQVELEPVLERLTRNDEKVESPLETQQFRQQLEVAINQLSDPHRSILIMRDVQGLSYVDIEQSLNLNQSQVKVYLHRARRQLRENQSLRRLALNEAIVSNTSDSPQANKERGISHAKH